MVKNTRSISVSQFKAKCLGLFERVGARGESFIVTKRGRPIARVEPIDEKPKRQPPPELKGSVLRYDRPDEPVFDPLSEDGF